MNHKNLNAKRWCEHGGKAYIWAFLGVLFAFSTRFALHPLLESNWPLFLFQVNTIVISYYLGLLPAIFSFVLSAPLIVYFFLVPFNTFDVIEPSDIRIVIVYGTYTALTGILIEKLRREQYTNRLNTLVSYTRLKYIMETRK